MLAMHMANELLTRSVAGAFFAIAAVALVLAARAAQTRFDPARIPLMGVLGAFVFAAQMINFPIPVGGISGHLGGGVLLAILLGPHAASLVMASILIVQCLIFQDGGILALGANILNMGVIPSYVGHALFRSIAGRGPSAQRLFVAILTATLVGINAGAMMVPIQTRLSDVLAVPFSRFLLMMIGLHLVIALFEAFITFAVIAYLMRVRPMLLAVNGINLQPSAGGLAPGSVVTSILVVALLLGGIGALLASSLPDALDSLTGGIPGRSMVRASPDPAVESATRLQEQTAPLPEYGVRGHEAWWGTSLSGIIGTLLTLGVVWFIGRRMRPASMPDDQVDPPPADPGRHRGRPLQRDSRERFSDRVDDYARFRPGYPANVATILAEELDGPAGWDVADVGSGTGILTEVLLRAGHRVYAVEPNAPMRAAAEASLGNHPEFVSIAATAEATTLADQSVDVITAGQAFHWFDLEATRREFARILRPGGIVAAIWNTRKTDSPFGAAYEQLITRYGTDYARVGPSHRETAGLLPAFFRSDKVHRHVVANEQSLDLEGLRGRLLSSSYIPNRGHPDFDALMRELDALFRAHEVDGRIRFDYDTEIYVGRFG